MVQALFPFTFKYLPYGDLALGKADKFVRAQVELGKENWKLEQLPSLFLVLISPSGIIVADSNSFFF